MDPVKAKNALRAFMETIDATGGICSVEEGNFVAPAIDEEWTDLGDAYLMACNALGVTPIYDKPEEPKDAGHGYLPFPS